MCGKGNEENTPHLYLECKMAYNVWMKIRKWLKVTMVIVTRLTSDPPVIGKEWEDR